MAGEPKLVLGLDIGTASIGWALVDQAAHKLVRAGVRIFDSGMDPLKFERGEPGASNNLTRRMARLRRRQLRRRTARQRDLFELLQQAGLLPPRLKSDPANRSAARHAALERLDKELRSAWRDRLADCAAPEHVLLYALRARALDERLEPFDLGRALCHLSQRRGFKSNRREGRGATKKEEQERGKVDAGIETLRSEMRASGARTLGEHFCRIDPTAARIRARWTARSMYEAEFEAIWSSQAPHHPAILTDGLRQQVRHLLFFQRPIAANEHLIGECELEPGCRRAPMATLAAQRFRLMQKVNDLAVIAPDLQQRRLDGTQRKQLADALETQGDLTFAAIRKLLGLGRGTPFNLEAGGEKKLRANRTAAIMAKAFGDGWLQFTVEARERIVETWRTTESPEELSRIARADWQLDATAASLLANTAPEDGYCSLSLKAISNILPLMEEGLPFKTAEERVYGSRFAGDAPLDRLPPVEDALPRVPNPAVMRSLTELRKLVNGIVREYGKPAEIRIEMARDLKRNAEQREAMWRAMREQEKRRAAAKKKLLEEAGLPNPSGADIEKALLWEECAGVCPYTGKAISFRDLFSGEPQFQVEHILPRNRFPDDSFNNKTLCHYSANADKTGRTPYETFGTTEEWERIIERVRRLRNSAKLERFLLKSSDELDDFSQRQLNDTRYASKLAARYIGALYGGRDVSQGDGSKRRVVFASSGSATATLRRAWGLEAILREAAPSANGQNRGKPRGDHRHHAVDALVVALSSNAAIQQLSAAAAAGDRGRLGRISSRTLQAPWVDFVDSVRPQILDIAVSHRPNHKLNGPLHDETNYSGPKQHGKKEFVHVRKPVHTLSAKQIEQDIVDSAVREAVKAKLAELGAPAKLEKDLPMLTTRLGKQVPIRRVRVRVPGGVTSIGSGPRQRNVSLNGNHHVPIFAVVDRKGRERWETPGVVSRYEAIQRQVHHQPVIQRLGTRDANFLFSLASGDMVEMDDQSRAARALFVVRTVSGERKGAVNVELARANDARLKDEMRASGDFIKRSVDRLRELHCRKVVVDFLGRVRAAND